MRISTGLVWNLWCRFAECVDHLSLGVDFNELGGVNGCLRMVVIDFPQHYFTQQIAHTEVLEFGHNVFLLN